jgi:hypothetical protein
MGTPMENDDKQTPEVTDRNIKVQDLIDLWKYFQDRADMLKDRQWTVATWLLTLITGLVAFSLNQQTPLFASIGAVAGNFILVLVVSLVGIAIIVFGVMVVLSYGSHIRRNWKRADRVKAHVRDLQMFWDGTTSESDKQAQEKTELPKKNPSSLSWSDLPKESHHLLVILAGFGVLFVGMICLSVFTMWFYLVVALVD